LIRYLKNSEIDIRKWDKCINQSFNGNPYALSWYLDVIHEGWEALVENDYERVMPLTGRKKFGISYLFQPYFAQQLGVFSRKKLSPKIVKTFLDSIPSHFRFIEIKLNSFNKPVSDDPSFSYNNNFVLDLINEYPVIADKYSTNTKRNLKKGIKHDLSLMKNIKPEVVIDLFRENRGKTLRKWTDKHYNILKRLMYSAIFKGRGVVYGVFNQHNDINAGAFFIRNNNRLIFLFSGSNDQARKNAAMTFLIDGVIEEYTPSQMVLDFEGSNDANLARFYKGFGAKKTIYLGWTRNSLNFPLKQMFAVYKSLKSDT
jgi:hypothetical protein